MKKSKLIFSLFLTMLKIGLFTFGGGYAMIALLENEFVSKRAWIDKEEFLDMAAIAESTLGPIAINAAPIRISPIIPPTIWDVTGPINTLS